MLRWICYLPTRSNLGNLMCFNCAMEPGVVAHTFNHSRGRGRWVSREFKARLIYTQQVPGQPGLCSESLPQKPNKNEGMQWKKFPSKTLLKKDLCKPKKLNYCSKTEGKQWMTFSKSKILGGCLKLAMQRQTRMNSAFVCFFWHLEGKPSIARD